MQHLQKKRKKEKAHWSFNETFLEGNDTAVIQDTCKPCSERSHASRRGFKMTKIRGKKLTAKVTAD